MLPSVESKSIYLACGFSNPQHRRMVRSLSGRLIGRPHSDIHAGVTPLVSNTGMVSGQQSIQLIDQFRKMLQGPLHRFGMFQIDPRAA